MTAIEFNYQLTGLKNHLERFATSLTLNVDDADDLVQETFLKAISYRDKYRDDTNLKAWTFTIMKNTFINNYKKNKRTTSKNDSIDKIILREPKPLIEEYAPDIDMSTKEIEKTIHNLEDEYKVPLIMYIDGFKYKEIAEKLDLNIGTVKSRIFLSRKKLMELLKEYSTSISKS